MRNIKILMDLIFTISTLTNASQVDKTVDCNFREIIVPPIRMTATGESTDIVVKLNAKNVFRTSNLSLKIFFTSSLCSKKLLYSESVYSIKNRGFVNYTYDEFNGFENCIFSFEIGSAKGAVLKKEVCPKLWSKQNYSVKTGIQKSLDNIYFYNDGEEQYVCEELVLTGFDGPPLDYGYIDLNSYRFETIFNGEHYNAHIDKITLTILKSGKYFSKIGYNEIANISSVELEAIEESKGCYHLSLKKELFVDRLTLMMSSTYFEGCVPTKDYFYLPRGAIDDLSEVYFGIGTAHFGFSRYQFSHSFEIKSGKELFGYCQDSKYCVESHISKNDGDRGVVIKP